MLALPAAYFSSFDHIVRKQLDPVWNKVGSSTKALVRDLGVLRRLVGYLLTYDPLQFHSFCETLIASNGTSASGGAKSQWMLTDAANIIFSVAKQRCFTSSVASAPQLDDDDDAWQVLDEIQGERPATNGDRPRWIPRGMDPVLEELPKWSLLAEVLEEIEGEIVKIEGNRAFNSAPGTNTTLVMCSSTTTCNLLGQFMDSLDQTRPKGEWGRKLMMKKLRTWLFWRSRAAKDGRTPAPSTNQRQRGDMDDALDEALKKKDRDKADRRANRRRIRGGAPGAAASGRQPSEVPEAITEDL